MTNEELMALGYQPSMGSPDLNAAQAAVSPRDLQQFYGAASDAPVPSMPTAGPQNQVDPALLAQLMGSAPSADQQNMVNANQLQMMSTMGVIPQSDPNGLTSDQLQSTDVPSGGSMVLPPNLGPDNTYGSTSASSPRQQQDPPSQPQYSEFDNFMIQTGRANVDLTPAERLQAHKAFDALMLKKVEMQDPEKVLKLQQMQHDISTQALKDQNLQAQTAESQSKVIAGELAKQNAQDTVSNQIADLQTQRDNLVTVARHPELGAMTGLAGQYNPGVTGSQRDLKARLKQLEGQQLIGGINKIKDEAANPNGTLGLRITQQEAIAVRDAVQRLQRYQDPATFSNSAMEAAKFLDKGIAAKRAQLSRMPSVNQDLLKQFSYTASGSSEDQGTPPAATAPAAPMIKTIPGKGTFQSLGNGQWKQIQ